MTRGAHTSPMPNLTMVPPLASAHQTELLLDHVRPVGTSHESRLPVYRAMFYTFDISARFLAACAVGKGTISECDRLMDTYWRRIFMSGNGRVSRVGAQHFSPGQPHVVMTNHSSLLDIPALMAAVPGSLRMVMKEELGKIPVWGHACVASGFIPIDRKNRDKAIAQLESAKSVLNKGVNMWISPEGTRARDDSLAAFKKGGFHLAMDLGLPIIPGWIEGAQSILKPDQFVVVPDGHVCVRFGAPIGTTGRTKAEMASLMAEVRSSIVALSGRADPLAMRAAA